MTAHEVHAHSTHKHINEAVEWFYFFAYQRFNMCFPQTQKGEGNENAEGSEDPSCTTQYSKGTCASETFLYRQNIVYHMTTELCNVEKTSKDEVDG